MWEILQSENHVDDVQVRQTDESLWMMSQMVQAKQLHKSVAQISCTNQSHKSITQDGMMS